MSGGATLFCLCSFAVAQLARANRANQLAMAEAGAIQPLVAMLGSPNPEMQANAAGALASLSRSNAENQAAIARTGAIAPLTSLAREGASAAKEQVACPTSAAHTRTSHAHRACHAPHSLPRPSWSCLAVIDATHPPTAAPLRARPDRSQCAAALWALSEEHTPNKATVTKLGGIEPLVTLLVGGTSEESLTNTVGALGSLASRHAENCEAIAKQIVARLTSRVTMNGAAAVRVLLAVHELCHHNPPNQLAIARAGGLPPLISWLSGGVSEGRPFYADAQREAAHALLAVCASNAPLQAAVAKLGGITPLIGLISSDGRLTQVSAPRLGGPEQAALPSPASPPTLACHPHRTRAHLGPLRLCCARVMTALALPLRPSPGIRGPCSLPPRWHTRERLGH